jgi:TRAP-type C4-dicarboxylate transport system substrate-binding protein
MKRILLTAAGAALASGLILGSASAQETINWVYANGYAKDHIQVGVLADEFIKRVEEATNGRLKIRHVPGGALLKPENMIEGVRGGVANMGSTVVSFFPGQLPISATLAGLVDLNYGNKLDFDALTAITTQLLKDIPEFTGEYEKLGLKAIWFVPSPAYAIISKDPITKLSDFSGKKIRTFGNVLPKLLNSVGAVPLSVAFGEIYTSIQTGVIDGAMTDPPAMLTGKFEEVAKHVVTTGPKQGAYTAIAPVAYIVNLDSWNALPKDIQDAIEKVAADMRPVASATMAKAAAGAFSKLEEGGATVHHITQEETDEWAKKAPDSWKLAAGILNDSGLPGDKIVARYKELAEGYINGTWRP